MPTDGRYRDIWRPNDEPTRSDAHSENHPAAPMSVKNVLPEPAGDWFVSIRRIGSAIRASRASPAAISNGFLYDRGTVTLSKLGASAGSALRIRLPTAISAGGLGVLSRRFGFDSEAVGTASAGAVRGVRVSQVISKR